MNSKCCLQNFVCQGQLQSAAAAGQIEAGDYYSLDPGLTRTLNYAFTIRIKIRMIQVTVRIRQAPATAAQCFRR